MLETDYLVIGSGASALAFVDTMLAESDATFTIVDRRHAPGGHWNDAYPFVKLHQPSATYGVASSELGHRRVDRNGFNAGLLQLASGVEVTAYFHELMNEVLLPSQRVSYHPLHEYEGDGVFASVLTGARREVQIRKSVVDATLLTTRIPLTHEPTFKVADGVNCIPPNHLPRLCSGYRRFTVLGAGKTGIDSVLWLLEQGVSPDAISWVVPRDPWMIDRSVNQSGARFFDKAVGALSRQFEICATANSIDELCEHMEAARIWMRLDSSVEPSMFHGPLVSEIELGQLRRLRNVIRSGHVRNIEPERLVLTEGEVVTEPGTLYIDCTAGALGANVGVRTPVFEPGKISLQMLRPGQPCFSAALVGHLEATIDDTGEKNRFATPTPMTDTVLDWVRTQIAGLRNHASWSQEPELMAWMQGCRLDAIGTTLAEVSFEDPKRLELLVRLSTSTSQAIDNLQRLEAAYAG